MRFWIINLVPTNSETTAVTRRSWIAALKIPVIRGICVVSEIAVMILLISSFERVIFEVWIVPALFTNTFFPSPGTSTLKTEGSIRNLAIFPSWIFPPIGTVFSGGGAYWRGGWIWGCSCGS